MKTLQTIFLAAALSGAPWLASAAGTPSPQPAPAASSRDDAPKSQEDLERQLEQARQQLAEAARKVAELSMQLNGDAMGRMIVMRDRMDKMQKHGYLGADLDNDDDKSPGAVLSGVTPGGPADKAGLRAGDVITGINGNDLKPSGEQTAEEKLVDFMRGTKPGDSLKVAYTRDGKAGTATVTAGNLQDMDFAFFMPGAPMAPMPPMPPIPPMPPHAPRMPGFNNFFGMGAWGETQFVSMSPELAQYFGTDKGLLVLHTEKDSPLQLQDGDVILAIGGRDPGTPPHAMRILGSYGPGESVKIDIMRKGKPVTLNVTLPKGRYDAVSNAFNWSFSASDDAEDSR